jgi:hypothetical protein
MMEEVEEDEDDDEVEDEDDEEKVEEDEAAALLRPNPTSSSNASRLARAVVMEMACFSLSTAESFIPAMGPRASETPRLDAEGRGESDGKDLDVTSYSSTSRW